MGFDLLGTFFNDANAENTKPETPKQESAKAPETKSVQFPDTTAKPAVSFPTQAPVYTTPVTNYSAQGPNCDPHIEAVLKQYEAGFEGLNLPGYDFFEFFKMVTQTGIDNPQVYDMAFTMGKTLESSLTKEKLITDAQFYIGKINEVYQSFNSEGENKKNVVLHDKEAEGGALSREIELKRLEIETAQRELSEKEDRLRKLDEKYNPLLNEVNCKITANNVAKDKMISLITKVMNNIK